jgi:hypothetical protein
MKAAQRNRIILSLFAVWIACSVAGTVLAAGKRKSGSHGKVPAAQHSNGSSSRAADVGAAPAGKSATAKPVAEVKPQSGDLRAGTREAVRQESRIEFDERMLRGQSASGVIYLFQRTPSEFKSIVQVPDSFRPRTVEILSPGKGRR